MRRATRYLWQCAGASAAIALSLSLLVVAVDPYRAFGTPAVAGLTELKPRAFQQSGLAKSRILARSHARTVLLGNSRVEIGVDPASDLWPKSFQPVVNAAEAGTGLDQALCRLEEAIADGQLELAVLGVDIQDFLVTEAPVASGPPATPDATDPCDRETTLWGSVFSIDAVVDSVLTIAGQDRRYGITMDDNGFNPLRDYQSHVRQIGYEGLFVAKMAAYRAEYARKPAPAFTAPEQYAPFRTLRTIMQTATAHGIRLVVYMHPYHAQYLDMLRELGLWQSFQAWKRQVEAIARQESVRASAPIRVLDFSVYDWQTCEPVSPRGGPEMRWYWEPGHYKSALGSRIIETILAEDGTEN